MKEPRDHEVQNQGTLAWKKHLGFGATETWVQIPALPLITCDPGQMTSSSESQVPCV